MIFGNPLARRLILVLLFGLGILPALISGMAPDAPLRPTLMGIYDGYLGPVGWTDFGNPTLLGAAFIFAFILLMKNGTVKLTWLDYGLMVPVLLVGGLSLLGIAALVLVFLTL